MADVVEFHPPLSSCIVQTGVNENSRYHMLCMGRTRGGCRVRSERGRIPPWERGDSICKVLTSRWKDVWACSAKYAGKTETPESTPGVFSVRIPPGTPPPPVIRSWALRSGIPVGTPGTPGNPPGSGARGSRCGACSSNSLTPPIDGPMTNTNHMQISNVSHNHRKRCVRRGGSTYPCSTSVFSPGHKTGFCASEIC